MRAVVDRSLRDFRAIYREHLGFVAHALHRFGTGADLLDDAVQDVFVVAYRRRHDYAGPSTKAWLYGISRRVASNYRRAATRHHQRRRAYAEALPRASYSGLHESIHALDRYLAGLRIDDRELFILSELEGMSGPEIAKARGRNVQTIYTRIRKLRAELAVDVDVLQRVHETRPRATAHAWAVLVPMLGSGKPAAVAGSATTGWLASLTSGWGLAAVGAAAIVATVAGLASRADDAPRDTHKAKTTVTAPLAQRDAPAERPPSEQPVANATVQVAALSPAVVPAPVAVRANKAGGSAPRAPTPSPPDSGVAQQNDLLRRAAVHLRAGEADQALAITNDLARRFGDSPLADLRTALRIEALCQQGNRAQARGEARVFIGANPGSPVVDRVRESCPGAS